MEAVKEKLGGVDEMPMHGTAVRDFKALPSMDVMQRTADALKAHNIEAVIAANAEDAKEKVLAMIPKGAEVMNMTSATADALGITKEILESGKYNAVRMKLMDPDVTPKEKAVIGATSDWTIGSVHALTEDGHAVIASGTGSQLGAYAYGSPHVVWVVGAQKIVKNLDEAFTRIYDYTLPLESKRVQTAYGKPRSFVNKMLIVNNEGTKNRISVVIVPEVVGF